MGVMLPHKHIAISAALGIAGWMNTGRPSALLYAIVPGVLPDIDHAVDYAYYGCFKEHRLILPLHGYEYVLLGSVVASGKKDKLLWLAMLSYLIHLLSDQAENKTKTLGYSLLYRLRHRFRLDEISTLPEDATRGRMADIQMLVNVIRRVLNRPS
jgi:hypothetical protein